ncbi:uncharacterized protein KY384_001546 [Bacidia gigantensis]|uniref:uncharacterized protein n=1 Tax=Bacidia gigantensis TaxID=2732470 RepID=UPI001D0520D4|nr:uncharacterized protein KY384_001546 [Bacidia gigantensis]KAG8533805.1 hypothetical protein KY384_001546 [Bacidia gigantensis]
MSLMRNAIQRRNHKERAQPREREKWGLLEKHKDYSLRARDYNAKKARLNILRAKAADRNPDEFHYGMLSSQSKTGRKIVDRGNPVLSHEAAELLKTQDSGYLQTMLQSTRRAIEKLESEIVLTKTERGIEVSVLGSEQPSGKQTVFVEYESDRRQRNNRKESQQMLADEDCAQAAGFGADESKVNKSRKQLEEKKEAQSQAQLATHKLRREQSARRAKLKALKTREKDLRDADNELELQRAKMRNVIGGVNKDGVKFKLGARKK